MDDPLFEKGLEFFNHDVKTQVQENGIYRYPDLVVAPVADDEHDFIVKFPVMLVEVANQDSNRRDRVKKRKEYREIASLWYYLVVNQDEMLVECTAARRASSGRCNILRSRRTSFFFQNFHCCYRLPTFTRGLIFS